MKTINLISRMALVAMLLTLNLTLRAQDDATQPVVPLDYIPASDFTTIVFVQSNDPNPEEQAAQAFFEQCFPNCLVLSAQEFMKCVPYDLRVKEGDTPGSVLGWFQYPTGGTKPDGSAAKRDLKVIWIHCNRADMAQGLEYLESHYPAGFTDKLKNLSKWGARMYLSGQAVQFAQGIGRVNVAPAIYASKANTTSLTETWSVTGWISSGSHVNAPFQDGNFMYGYILDAWKGKDYVTPMLSVPEHYEYTNGNTNYEGGSIVISEGNNYQYPLLAPQEGKELWINDNNCMWKYNNTDFQNNFNCLVTGTWGQNNTGAATEDIGIVQFLVEGSNPGQDGYYDEMVTNGIAANEFAPGFTSGAYDPDANRYKLNQWKLNYNPLQALAVESQQYTSVETIDAPSNSEAEAYYTISGQRVAAPNTPGIYIRIHAGKPEKVLVR